MRVVLSKPFEKSPRGGEAGHLLLNPERIFEKGKQPPLKNRRLIQEVL